MYVSLNFASGSRTYKSLKFVSLKQPERREAGSRVTADEVIVVDVVEVGVEILDLECVRADSGRVGIPDRAERMHSIALI